jgi:hypothetical protein
VNYVIGKSDFRKDWFFQHVPHNEDHCTRGSLFQASVASASDAVCHHFDLPQRRAAKQRYGWPFVDECRAIEATVNDQRRLPGRSPDRRRPFRAI